MSQAAKKAERTLYNPWHPDADQSVVHKLANARSTRVIEMEKPGPVTIIDLTDGRSVRPIRAKGKPHLTLVPKQRTKAAPAAKQVQKSVKSKAKKADLIATLNKSAAKKLEQKKATYSALFAFNAHVALLKQGGMAHRDAVAQAADDRKAGLI